MTSGSRTKLLNVRDTRLSRSLSGTNLERASDYNQRTVLQAIRLVGETTRIDLAKKTGLTPPTIANIAARLIDAGYVKVAGRRQGGRGQPPLRLQLQPGGACSIGLNIDRDHLTLVVLDLAGDVRARITRDVQFALPDDVAEFVRSELDALLARGGIAPAKIIGTGVALPDDLGRIDIKGRPANYAVWSEIDLRNLLDGIVPPRPLYLDNDAAAAAMGEAHCGATQPASFFYLLISAGLGGGPVIDRNYHRGATARSGEVGLLPDATKPSAAARVQDTVSLTALVSRLRAAGETIASLNDLVVTEGPRRVLIDQWIEDCVESLEFPMMAVNTILDPDAILIGGRLPQSLIERLVTRLNQKLRASTLPSLAPVKPATMAQDAAAIGAAILPFLDQVLPSDAILIKSADV